MQRKGGDSCLGSPQSKRLVGEKDDRCDASGGDGRGQGWQKEHSGASGQPPYKVDILSTRPAPSQSAVLPGQSDSLRYTRVRDPDPSGGSDPTSGALY